MTRRESTRTQKGGDSGEGVRETGSVNREKQERAMTRDEEGITSLETPSRRAWVTDEGLEKVEMEAREESPEGGCNPASGSNISLQQRHKYKHTSRYP